jgi:hypothetical protein
MNKPFTIEEAIKCINDNVDKDISKETLRSSIEIARRNELILVDSILELQAYYNYQVRGKLVDRGKLKHYDKVKTFYCFNEKNLVTMIKRFSFKPRDEDITPEIVKLFLDPERK